MKIPNNKQRNCIILSPYFPPSTLAGVHRARHLAKHLPNSGWNPIVLCVHEAYHEYNLDPALAELVPSTIKTVKATALSQRVCRPLGFGEISLRAFIPIGRHLWRLLNTQTINVVFITGSPFYPMLFATAIKRRFRVPVVLDFQDPWVSAWGSTQPRLSKTGMSHLLATVLEPRALRGASYITSVSDELNAQMAERYQWLDRRRMAAIPIGSDKDDFDAMKAIKSSRGLSILDLDYINISYVGTIWPPVIPTVQTVFRSVARLRNSHPALYSRLRFNFVGTSGNPNGHTAPSLLPIAKAEGVEDVVYEVPQRVPYLDALAIVSNSDAILLLGSDEPHYTASKIYPYLISGRPYLSVYHSASSAHAVLSKAGGGVALSFSSLKELAEIEGEITSGLFKLTLQPKKLGQLTPSAFANYQAPQIADRFAEIFNLLDHESETGALCA